MMKKSKLKAIFPYTADKALLSLVQGDVISLLISEEKASSWLPWSYTNLLEENGKETVTMATPCPAPKRSISLMNLSEKSSVVVPLTELFGIAADKIVCISKNAFTFKASVSKLEIIFPNAIS
ncbi:hypothetical protein HPG69_019799, partial [Diceros bicornis minor]